MACRYEMEVTVTSAKDLKNVNWRYGRLKPYAVVWIEPNNKCSTRVDDDGDIYPYWDQKLIIPFISPIQDSTFHLDLVHANAKDDTKPLIGSARLPLRDVGFGERATHNLDLKRPSGRPHGTVQLKICLRELRYRAPDPYYAPPPSREYSSSAPQPYGNSYAPNPYQQSAPPSGYPYGQSQPLAYGGQGSYGQAAPPPAVYGQGQESYYRNQQQQQQQDQGKKSKYGMGTGLAVGAVAGVLGGLALAEGVDYMEDKIADKAAEKVEDDDDDDDYDEDDY
ncbi:uncharacterized protein LOC114318552 [Camellia sinensis]|uniref:C2 domain-containing protein n=1 Tax=Camellia sinensis var. sinensis TaxID=542762 RepID=A0A4S4D362_CAMSN|nr:uncharacterized protein LOC114318552 [Camellia sinensis]THF95605.1 hypothetical protein TEA_016647 [Camellia sinensis var. sinensis]